MNEILKKIDERINELDVCLKGSNEIHERHRLRMMLGEVREMKEIILSQHKQLATDNNVVTKSGKDNNAKDADYWEREAKKWCAKLGEIRMLIGEQN